MNKKELRREELREERLQRSIRQNSVHPKVDWESEFAILLRYTERLEKINDQLIAQQGVLTGVLEKLTNGNQKV